MATGNPRNKVALKPGFSLIGWIRLTNSGEDLAKRKGAISYDELKKHNKIDDCWMSIRGKVYNVTRYMDFHPGGAEQLMRGAGKDATSLFDEYHAWVNIEQLLAKCYIGPLKNVVTLTLSDIGEKSASKKENNLSPPTAVSNNLQPFKEIDKSAVQVPAQIIPRFDWIQRKTDLTIYFYLKSFCNPGIYIEQICDKECKVTIFIGNIQHAYKFSFYKSLKWQPTLKVNQQIGKIEILFEKEEVELWPSYGMHERIGHNESHKFNEFSIYNKKFINHDSFELTLRPKNEKMLYFISLGHHVDLKINLNGRDVIRSYTPIPSKYVSCESNLSHINFVIKRYTDGNLSKSISERSVGDDILVSQQLGSFQLTELNDHTDIAFLAAGSGITPFCGLLEHLLTRNVNQIKKILLYNFNKTEQDIWFQGNFNDVAQNDKRFEVKHILSEPDESWTGERGKVSERILEELTKLNITIVLVCGPVSFNSESLRILSGSPKIKTICFQG